MKLPSKLNRRTAWKFSRAHVLYVIPEDMVCEASIGPAGRSSRFFQFFGGFDGTTIQANSRQKFWERMDAYVSSFSKQDLERARVTWEEKRQRSIERWEQRRLERQREAVGTP